MSNQIPTPTIDQPTIHATKNVAIFVCRSAATPFVKAAAARQKAETEASNRLKLN
jgi:hypothetical protein